MFLRSFSLVAVTSLAGCVHVASIRDVAAPVDARVASLKTVQVMIGEQPSTAFFLLSERHYRSHSDGRIVAKINGQLTSHDPVIPFDTEIELDVMYRISRGDDGYFISTIELARCEAPMAHLPVAEFIQAQHCIEIGRHFSVLWQAVALPNDYIYPSRRILHSTLHMTSMEGVEK